LVIQKRNKKNARYLAIRIVCILDKYLQDCTDVVKDNGLLYGQRTADGYLQPQIKNPGPPVYPDDVDWKSIDHELMFSLLSLPSEVEDGDRIIKATWAIAGPPDFEDWFDERKFYYSQFGLMAYKLSYDLSSKYGIKKKTYNNWSPVDDLKQELELVARRRHLRTEEYKKLIKKILG
jgi:hypothetical protein